MRAVPTLLIHLSVHCVLLVHQAVPSFVRFVHQSVQSIRRACTVLAVRTVRTSERAVYAGPELCLPC